MDRAAGDIESVVIDAPCGRLAGERSGDVLVFKGIPFAKPPVGDLRWRVPEPAAPWTGARDATQFGPICPQAPSQVELLLGGALGEQSEDCLYLNVWTPACDGAARPTMVWIYGGAFVIGAGSQAIYNGARLAARDCVVVTFNYRLGAFGFLNLADATEGRAPGSGTEGIGDQILALHWIKRNIAAFGGDPDNVTVFGESAGAMSVAMLLSIPPARGLFHKAICQSGAAHVGNARERSARVAHALLEKLGASASDAENLRGIPSAALVKAQIALLADLRAGRDTHRLGAVAFQPTIDGNLVPGMPIDAIRVGAADGIPLIAGTTKDEWRLFSAASAKLRLMSNDSFEKRVKAFAGADAPPILAAYSKGHGFDRFNAMMTDRAFAVPAMRMLDAQAPHGSVYAYRFDWSSRFLGGILGACHALELGFVFGTYSAALAGAVFGRGPTADALSDAMMTAWTNFARTGDPGSAWPRYDAGSRGTAIFGDGRPRVVQRPNAARVDAWKAIPDDRLGP